MSDLLPCPFCGEGLPKPLPGWQPQEWGATQEDSGSWCVGCNACGATGGLRNTPEEAEGAWNVRRAQHIMIENTVYRITGDIEIAHRRATATGERVLLSVSATHTTEGTACHG